VNPGCISCHPWNYVCHLLRDYDSATLAL
jgi:hypothetical protein